MHGVCQVDQDCDPISQRGHLLSASMRETGAPTALLGP
jgi:hypothetical protein